jgi:phospholipase C
MKKRTLAQAAVLAVCLAAPAFSQCTLNSASPSVTICTPSNNASLSSPVPVVAGTTDNEFAVRVIQIYVDGKKAYERLAGSLDTTVVMTTGTHKLTVQAMDTGNRTFKSSITVNVTGSQPPTCTLDPTQPSVTICSPLNGATVASPVHVEAQSNCQCTVRVMQVYVDGSKKFESPGPSLTADVAMTAGSHRLTVQAVTSTNTTFKSTLNVTVSATPPPPVATNSPIKHIIVVVMQNRSFDHLFGTMAGVEGINPGVPGYSQADANGNIVTPSLLTDVTTSDLPHSRQSYLNVWNSGAMDKYAYYNGALSMGHYDNSIAGVDQLWTWAQTYALADNYFPSVMSNAPANPLYMVSASDNNFPWSFQPVYGPCNKDDAAAVALTYPNVGDQMTAKNVSWAWYQENYGACSGGYIPQENPFQYFTSTHDAPNLKDLSYFYTDLTNGTLPAVSYVQPNPTHNGHPGSGSFTTALNWLDGFLRKVQDSSSWADTAVVVTWDESGGWWDHVPPPQVDSQGLGQRVPLIVVSPYAKKGHVSSIRMDHVSILKWIQWNWNLGTLNARNAQSNDISDMFQF